LLSFGTYFVSSFCQQCEYPIQDPNNIDENFKKKIKILPPEIRENITKTLMNSIIKTNEEGIRSCRNKYNIFLSNDYFVYFIVFAAAGYLIASFLKSYSVIKLKSIIYIKFISIDVIIILMGILGLVLSIILLFISSLIPCGKSDYSHKFCSSAKMHNNNTEYYFDNFLYYIVNIRDDLFPKEGGYNVRKPKDTILEIIFSFLMSAFGFYKMKFDLSIIKELGVFHLLIPEVIYQFVIDLYIIVYKIVNNIIDNTQKIQFIFILISQLFALIGILIYLELIELRFCNLDNNLKINISRRATEDIEAIAGSFSNRSSLLDDNNENNNNDGNNNNYDEN